MKLNIPNVEAPPTLSLKKNWVSKLKLGGHLGVQTGQPRFPKNFKAIVWLCFQKKTFGRFLAFSGSEAQHFLPKCRFSISYTYRENRV